MRGRDRAAAAVSAAFFVFAVLAWFYAIPFPGSSPLLKVRAGTGYASPGESEYGFTLGQFTPKLFVRFANRAANPANVSLTILDSNDGVLLRMGTLPSMNSTIGFGNGLPAGTYRVRIAGDGAYSFSLYNKPPATPWTKFAALLVFIACLTGLCNLANRLGFTRKEGFAAIRAAGAGFYPCVCGMGILALYLVFHEGGHLLVGSMFGTVDWQNSDIFGIRGNPHVSFDTAGEKPAPWQTGFRALAGPLLPTFVAWALFAVWRSKHGRTLRDRYPKLDLPWSAGLAAFSAAHLGMVPPVFGIVSNGDYETYIRCMGWPAWAGNFPLLAIAPINGWIARVAAKRLVRMGTIAQKAREGKNTTEVRF